MGERGATSTPFTTQLTDFDDALIKRDICSREQCLLAKGMSEAEVLDVLVAEDVAKELGKLDVAAAEAAAERALDPLKHLTQNATREELDELDEDDEYADDDFLAKYREARIEQLQTAAAKEVFGSVFDLEKADWVREVNEVSRKAWVFVHLFQDYVVDCVALSAVMNDLSARYPAVKFVKIKATSAVETWPDGNLPAVYLYRDGEMKHQLVGSRDISEGPPPFTADSVARKLAALKVVDALKSANAPPPPPPEPAAPSNVRRGAYANDDDATWDS